MSNGLKIESFQSKDNIVLFKEISETVHAWKITE